MAVVGSLFINMVAKVKPLEEGLNRTRKKLREFSTRMSTSAGRMEFFQAKVKSARKSLNRFGKRLNLTVSGMTKMAAASAVAGAAMVTALVVKGLRSVDALTKTAAKLGMTTQALAGMQHAAKLTGVSAETMNMALQRMVRRIAEAAMGTGEAKGALEELGISAQELNQLSPDKQFSRLADAIRQVENPADRVRLAMKLFDSEGVALVNTMRLGSAGMAEMAAEAEALGLAFSEKQGAAVERANDAMQKLWDLVTGLAQTFAIEMAPLIERVSNALLSASSNSGKLGSTFFQAIKGMIRGVGIFLDVWHTVKIAVAAFRLAFVNACGIALLQLTAVIKHATVMATIMSMGKVDFRHLVQGLEEVRDGLFETGKVYAQEIKDLWNEEWPSGQVDEFVRQLEVARNTINSSTAATEEKTKALMEQKLAVEELNKLAKEREDLMKEGLRVTESVMTPDEIFDKEIARLENLLDKGAISQETFTRAFDKAAGELADATQSKLEKIDVEVEPAVKTDKFSLPDLVGGIGTVFGEFKFGKRLADPLQKKQAGHLEGIDNTLKAIKEQGRNSVGGVLV